MIGALLIELAIEVSKQMDKPPPVDQWIVMDITRNVYFHKHLMYNIGIITGRGDMITICDSDAMVSPNFVESIIKSFEEKTEILFYIWMKFVIMIDDFILLIIHR